MESEQITTLITLMQQQMQQQQQQMQQQRQLAEAQMQQQQQQIQQQQKQLELQQQQMQQQQQQQIQQQQKQLELQQQQMQQQRQQADTQMAALLEAVSARSPPQFPGFRPDAEEWAEYIHRLEQHLLCYKVGDARMKKAFFLSCVGNRVTNLVKKLFPEREISSVKWAEMLEKLNNYFNKVPHVVAARFKFFQCRKSEGQTHSEWITELAGLARHCQFKCPPSDKEVSYAETLIRDMVVLHTPEEKIRLQALQSDNPSLEEIHNLCKTYEMTCETARQIAAESHLHHIRNSGSVRSGKTAKEYETDSDSSEYSDSARKGYRNKGGNHCEWRRNPRPSGKPVFKRASGSGSDSDSVQIKKSCKNCERLHAREQCRFRNAQCFWCKKVGHIREVCGKKRHAERYKKQEQDMEIDMISQVLDTSKQDKLMVKIELGKVPVSFLLDTGAAVTLINLETYRRLGAPRCQRVQKGLYAFGRTPIKVLGKVSLRAAYKKKKADIEVIVVDRYDVTNILGLDSFDKLGFGVIDSVNQVAENEETQVVGKLEQEFPEVFSPGLGECKHFRASIQLKEGHKPRFFKARPVPWALREKVAEELRRLQADGVITPVSTSQWATPLVVVKKANGSIRLCGDFKSTVNQQVEVEQYPIPKPEDLFYKLSGGRQFSKIDLRDAYLQLPLDQEAKEVLVINTPLGLFRYNRLPFGVNSAAALFQRCLEQLTAELRGCCNYLDDIIVTGSTEKEHEENLKSLFKVLQDNGLRVNKVKCEFFKDQVVFLGHVLDSTGISPTSQHVEAILRLPPPADVKQLQALLGKVNYYNKFIRNFSTIAAPLNKLRKKGVKFVWSQDCERALNQLKEALVKTVKLNHFVPGRLTTVAADASEYGLGAVLSQKDSNGVERPIAFASKSLNKHQRNYSQIEKEALGIIFAVRKFNDYLYGSKFHIITDHKPLVQLFHPGKRIPESTAKKLQRWALFLSDYNYQIHFRSTTQHANADALSRLPGGPDLEFDKLEEECLQIDTEECLVLSEFPLGARRVAQETDKDPELRTVRNYVREGWPLRCLRSNASWYNKKDRLTCKAGVLLLAGEEFTRVVIPKVLRKTVLDLLHEGHWGVVRTKQLARRHCFWEGMNSDIVQLLKRCEACQLNQSAPRKDLVPWPEPSEPWERVHVDFAGPFWDKMWLVVVDAKSNYPYVVEMANTTSTQTINALERIFVTEGLPVTLVSDNGTQFTSQEFANFCASNGIQHVCAPPFHPQSNGEAERFVRTFKTAMSKARAAGTHRSRALLRVLVTFRTLPGADGRSPAEVLHGRQPRTLLSLLSPVDPYRSVGTQPRFQVGDMVYCTSFKKCPAWLPGIVTAAKGNRTYLVRTEGRVVTRHQGQLRPRVNPSRVDSLPKVSQQEFYKKVMRETIYIPQETAAAGTSGQDTAEPPPEEVSEPGGEGAVETPRAQLRPRRSTRRVRFAPYTTQLGAEGVVTGRT